MLALIVAGIVAVGVLCALTLRFLEKTTALLIVMGVVGLGSVFGLSFASHAVGLNIVQTGKIGGYKQFLNGSLVSADVKKITCEEDGACVHTDEYCDPYIYTWIDTYTDANGKVQTQLRSETRYHSCPQMTEEYVYTTTDNFGNVYTLGDHVFSANPVQWRSHDVSMAGSDKVARGVPPKWQQAKDNIAAGNADPVTVPNTYDNYILGSEKTILKDHSDDIERLKKDGLLPAHTANLDNPIHDDWKADKVTFIKGVSVQNAAAWQDELMRFNAALGMTKQGDLHVVVVKASSLPTSQESYLLALKAYWQSELGKNALAKNGIILILGVDDAAHTIEWASAGTGMPVGNGEMVQALQLKLRGKPFDLQTVFGTTKATIKEVNGKKKPVYTTGQGIVPQIIMSEYPFKRACMGCQSAEDKDQQGFVYLSTEIPLEGWALFWTGAVYVLIVCVTWGLIMAAYVYFAEEVFSAPMRSIYHSNYR